MILFSLCFLLFINSMSIGLVFPIFASMFTQSQTALFSPGTSANMHVFLYSMILAVPTFCMLFGAPFWGRLSDRIGRKNVLLISLSGLALSFAFSALGIWQNSLLVLFGSRALAGFMDGSESIAQAAIADMSTPQNKARQMGFATFSSTIGFIIGPTLGGFLAEPSLTGYYHFEFPFCFFGFDFN
jgi:DHA1 family tetracycline resistance protein-like MFS transporter